MLHKFNKFTAKKYGITCAIIIKLLSMYQEQVVEIEKSELYKMLPYLTKNKIRNDIKKLKKSNLIKVKQKKYTLIITFCDKFYRYI